MSFFNLFLQRFQQLLTSQGSSHHRYIIALDESLRLTASPSESRECWLSVDRVGVEQSFHRQLTGLGKLALLRSWVQIIPHSPLLLLQQNRALEQSNFSIFVPQKPEQQLLVQFQVMPELKFFSIDAFKLYLMLVTLDIQEKIGLSPVELLQLLLL